MRQRSNLTLVACGNPVVPVHPSVEEGILSPLSGLDILDIKNQLAKDVWAYFSTLNLIPFVYIFILMSISQFFNYYSFIICFEVGKCESSNFLFSRLFWLLGTLAMAHKFGT